MPRNHSSRTSTRSRTNTRSRAITPIPLQFTPSPYDVDVVGDDVLLVPPPVLRRSIAIDDFAPLTPMTPRSDIMRDIVLPFVDTFVPLLPAQGRRAAAVASPVSITPIAGRMRTPLGVNVPSSQSPYLARPHIPGQRLFSDI